MHHHTDDANLEIRERRYSRPLEIVEDRHLTTSQKRELLAAWASDAAAVESRPELRKLSPGSALASIDEIMAALDRLDAMEMANDPRVAQGAARMSDGLAADLADFVRGASWSEPFIGLFRSDPQQRIWHVTFPDLPGCEAIGKTFREAYESAQVALADELSSTPSHRRPRSTVELLIDANRDRKLQQDLAASAMHPVEPVFHLPLADRLASTDRTDAPSMRLRGGLRSRSRGRGQRTIRARAPMSSRRTASWATPTRASSGWRSASPAGRARRVRMRPHSRRKCRRRFWHSCAPN